MLLDFRQSKRRRNRSIEDLNGDRNRIGFGIQSFNDGLKVLEDVGQQNDPLPDGERQCHVELRGVRPFSQGVVKSPSPDPHCRKLVQIPSPRVVFGRESDPLGSFRGREG
jgi:hypothetical protein